jgi:hypothetical protein
MKIKLNKDLDTSFPGDHVVRRYQKGKTLYMNFDVSHIPGRPYTKGTFGWFGARESQKTDDPVHEEWVFWSHGDIDCALIIDSEDVETLWLTQQEYDRLPEQAINQATFEIVIDG